MKKLKKMKKLKFASIVLFILIIGNSCSIPHGVVINYSSNGLIGNGEVVKEDRKIAKFNGIEVSDAIDVIITQSENESIVTETYKNLQKNLMTEVKNGKLKIYFNERVKLDSKTKVYVYFRNLESIDLIGASSIKGTNKIISDKMNIELSGASDADLNLQAVNTTVDLSGAADLDLNLLTDDLYIELTGASDADINIDTKKLRIQASGASDIDLAGGCNYLDITASSASDVNALNLKADFADIDCSSSADVYVSVDKELKINASSAASVRFSGNPKITDYDVTAGADVSRR